MRRSQLWINVCLCLACLVRVWGIDFGLPYKFHPDEDKYIDPVLAWHTSGEMNLELINPPLFNYVLWAGYWLWFAVSPYNQTANWLTQSYVFARLWSFAFSMLTVALAYALGKRIYSRPAGLVAMILLAGLFLPAREAHFAVNDSAVTFFVLLGIYFSVRLLQKPSHLNYIMAGFIAGCAAAAKLTGGLVLAALLLAHFMQSKRNDRHLALSIGLMTLTFALISAHIFWRLPEYVEVINQHLLYGTSGYKGLQMAQSSGWLFYGEVLSWGIGWILVVLICLSLPQLFFYPHQLILVIFSILLFGFIGSQKIVFARFILPAVPPLIIFVAGQLVGLAQQWSTWQRHPRLIWGLTLVVLLAQPLASLVWFDHLLTLPDTREIATQWFTENVPAGTRVARESYSILPNTVFQDKEWPYDADNLSGSRQFKDGLEHYLNTGADILVVSNFTSGRHWENPAEETMRSAQLARLEAEATLLKTFNPYRTNTANWFYLDELYGPAGETIWRTRPGPLLKVYKLPR